MARTKKVTVNSLLVGDSLVELVQQAGASPDDKFILVVVSEQGVKLVTSPDMSRAEVLGSLYLAIDEVG